MGLLFEHPFKKVCSPLGYYAYVLLRAFTVEQNKNIKSYFHADYRDAEVDITLIHIVMRCFNPTCVRVPRSTCTLDLVHLCTKCEFLKQYFQYTKSETIPDLFDKRVLMPVKVCPMSHLVKREIVSQNCQVT